MKKIVLLTVALIPTIAVAQTPPTQQPFVPYTINEQQQQDFIKWLNEQPFKFSAPVINQLNVWEQQAQAIQAQADAKKKSDEANKKVEPPKRVVPSTLPKPKPEKKE